MQNKELGKKKLRLTMQIQINCSQQTNQQSRGILPRMVF